MVPPNRSHVFKKDLDQLVADLEAGDDKAAVLQRYRIALFEKNQVRCGFWSDLGPAAFTYPEVCVHVRKAGRTRESGQKGHTRGGPRQTS